jgi:hypothetical protein
MKHIILFFIVIYCPPALSQSCAHDLNGNGVVDGGDLLELLTVYGDFCSDEYEFAPVISEIHFNPAELQGLDSDWEFIELYNPHAISINLSGWELVDGVEAIIEDGVFIEAGRYVVLATTPSSYQGDLPYSTIIVQLSGDLDNSGESIRLLNSNGVEIDCVEYSDYFPWPDEADGFGASLEWIGNGMDNQDPESWMPSNSFGGSPGSANSTWAD